jgi:hypothetical protein
VESLDTFTASLPCWFSLYEFRYALVSSWMKRSCSRLCPEHRARETEVTERHLDDCVLDNPLNSMHSTRKTAKEAIGCEASVWFIRMLMKTR